MNNTKNYDYYDNKEYYKGKYGTNYTTYTTKETKPLKDVLLEKEDYIGEYDGSYDNEYHGRTIVAFEKLKGVDFKVCFDGSKVYVRTAEGKSTEIVNVLNKKYMKGFGKVVQKFNQVPFTAFGIYIIPKKSDNSILKTDSIDYIKEDGESKLVLYDIKINDNWVCQDHIKELFKENEIDILPELYKGTFHIDKLYNLLKKNSVFSEFENQPIEGIIIKPICEDDDLKFHRLIFKITNSCFKINTYFTKEEKVNINDLAIKTIGEFFKSSTETYVVNFWKERLNYEGIEIKTVNMSKILKLLVNETVDKEMWNYVFNNSSKEFISMVTLKKAIKKIMPKIIINKLELVKNLTKI